MTKSSTLMTRTEGSAVICPIEFHRIKTNQTFYDKIPKFLNLPPSATSFVVQLGHPKVLETVILCP